MSCLNNADKAGIGEGKEYWAKYPSYRFLVGLHDNGFLWTPNMQDYFLLREDWETNPSESETICLAYLRLNIVGNTWICFEEWKKYAVHIQCLCTQDDFRGVGVYSLLLSMLLRQADESGVFIYGHSRPFHISLPRLRNQEEASQWLRQGDGQHEPSLKKDKMQAKALLKKYLQYGFCRFDGTGVRCANRFWKKMHFGYRGASIESESVSRFLDEHLICA